MRKILLTGGAGFIGSHLTERLLEAGDAVTTIDNFNPFYDPAIKRRNVAPFLNREGYRLVEGDIRDAALTDALFAAERPEITVHLAAMAGVRPSIEQPVYYEEVNGIGTLNLLEAARRHGCEVFIFGSSSSVYGVNSKVPFSEEDPIRLPISPYATTKRANELMCFTYHHLYKMRISCLRFFTVYGPRQRPEMAIHKFTHLMAKGRPVPFFGDGQSRRDYTFVTDIIDGVMAAIEKAYPFEIFNLGGSETITLANLVELIETKLGIPAILDRQRDQPGDVPITSADVAKSGRMLGYSPKVRIEEGIGKFVDWYRETYGVPAPGLSPPRPSPDKGQES